MYCSCYDIDNQVYFDYCQKDHFLRLTNLIVFYSGLQKFLPYLFKYFLPEILFTHTTGNEIYLNSAVLYSLPSDVIPVENGEQSWFFVSIESLPEMPVW